MIGKYGIEKTNAVLLLLFFGINVIAFRLNMAHEHPGLLPETLVREYIWMVFLGGLLMTGIAFFRWYAKKPLPATWLTLAGGAYGLAVASPAGTRLLSIYLRTDWGSVGMMGGLGFFILTAYCFTQWGRNFHWRK